jgi:hypothetical protein
MVNTLIIYIIIFIISITIIAVSYLIYKKIQENDNPGSGGGSDSGGGDSGGSDSGGGDSGGGDSGGGDSGGGDSGGGDSGGGDSGGVCPQDQIKCKDTCYNILSKICDGNNICDKNNYNITTKKCCAEDETVYRSESDNYICCNKNKIIGSKDSVVTCCNNKICESTCCDKTMKTCRSNLGPWKQGMPFYKDSPCSICEEDQEECNGTCYTSSALIPANQIKCYNIQDQYITCRDGDYNEITIFCCSNERNKDDCINCGYYKDQQYNIWNKENQKCCNQNNQCCGDQGIECVEE